MAGERRRHWVVALLLRDRMRDLANCDCRSFQVSRQIDVPMLIAPPVAERQGYFFSGGVVLLDFECWNFEGNTKASLFILRSPSGPLDQELTGGEPAAQIPQMFLGTI